MLYFFKPYDFNQKLFYGYDNYINLLPNDDDWACLMDGDVAFLRSDFGHQIQEYIEKYPNAGLFTAYASRCGNNIQTPTRVDKNNDSLKYHINIANQQYKYQRLDADEVRRNIAGYMIVIKKSTWNVIREKVEQDVKNETIEGIDYSVCREVKALNMKILLMKGIYLLHIYRLNNKYPTKAKHLGYGDFITIITPCSRPENLHKIAESINIPRRSYQWIIVFDANKNDIDAELIPKNATPLFHKNNESIAGHAQRNYALPHIKEGMVYFLDDDNIMHPELYNETCRFNMSYDIIHFDQVDNTGKKRVGGKIEVNQVDTANVIVKSSIIGDTKFRTDKYNADGIFWKALSNKTTSVLYIPKTLSYYNKLKE